MSRNLVDIVGGILVRDHTVLLGKRADSRHSYPNVWDILGGHVEPHEQPVDTLIRELQEEIGITPTHYDLLERLEGPELESHGVHAYSLYVVSAWTGTPRNLQPQEHSAIQWFSLTDMIHLDLAHPAYVELFQRLAQRPDWG